MEVFEIVKMVGLGEPQCPYQYHSIGLLFLSEEEAYKEADLLWTHTVTEQERNSGWCSTHYVVKKRNIKN